MSHAGLSFAPQFARAALITTWLAAAGTAQTTWQVDASNPACPGSGMAADPFCTIGAAIAAAAPGDTIQVAAGTYVENLVVDVDDLTLLGAGADATTIVGRTTNAVVFASGATSSVTSLAIEGFRITSVVPMGSETTIGIRADLQAVSEPSVRISRCLVEGLDTGISLLDSYDPYASLVVEDTVITGCGNGIWTFGLGAVIRRCTIADLEKIGVIGSLPNTKFRLSDTIISGTGWWAVQRYWSTQVTIERVLVFDNNIDNPDFALWAGPFVQWLAEENGIYAPFQPLPGPIVQADPLFIDAVAGDLRLAPGSPAIDAGDPAAVAVPGVYDFLGFGHQRVDDGDFDGTEQIDLGAIEFGGLLLNGGLEGEFSAGQLLTATLAGPPGAACGLFAGLPGAPIDLGAKGVCFLAPSPLVLLAVGTLPASGVAVVLAAPLPAAASGLELALQAAHKAAATHWTNLERLSVGP